MEQLAVPPPVMRKRVEETLDLLGLADLRGRAAARRCPAASSSGSRSASVLTAHPRVLVLDEPTSALDPTAAEEVLAAITRLVHDLGVTVVLAEHRLERVVPVRRPGASTLPGDGTVRRRAAGRRCSADAAGRAAGRRARPAGRLAPAAAVGARRAPAAPGRCATAWPRDRCRRPGRPTAAGPAALTARGRRGPLRRRSSRVRDGRPATCAAGEVVALMGRNGSGKSSLLWALQGSGRAAGRPGRASTAATRGRSSGGASARALVGLVPQTAGRPALPGHRRRRAGRRPTASRGRPTGAADRADAARPARARHRRRRRTRGTCPRGSGSPWSSPSSCAPRPRCCCSTSRPAGWTTPPRRRWRASSRELAGDGPRGGGRHPRRGVRRRGGRPGRRHGRGRGRRRRPDRARCSSRRRRSPRRSPRCSRRCRTSPSTRSPRRCAGRARDAR